MTSYTKIESGDLVDTIVASVMRDHHSDLTECGVRIGILMAHNPNGDAVRHAGYPALASVRVVSLKDRVSKGYDVEMLIDQTAWDALRPRQRVAVIDHELTHVRRVPNTPQAIKAGELAWKTDDLGRPKIKLRKGDYNVGDGFADVIARYGDDAVEWQNIRRAMAYANEAKEKGELGAVDRFSKASSVSVSAPGQTTVVLTQQHGEFIRKVGERLRGEAGDLENEVA